MQRNFNKLTELADKIAPYHEFIVKVAQERCAQATILSSHFATADLLFYQGVCKEAINLIGLPGGRIRDMMESITAEEKEELQGILKDIELL